MASRKGITKNNKQKEEVLLNFFGDCDEDDIVYCKCDSFCSNGDIFLSTQVYCPLTKNNLINRIKNKHSNVFKINLEIIKKVGKTNCKNDE